MATVTKPIALDESLNTTEATPRNIADVLAEGIGDLIHAVSQIAPQTVYDLDDLGDVDITSPSNGQVLKYNGTSQKWENGTGGGSGDSVSWSQIQQSGTKIAEIEINGVTTDVYAPTGGGFSALLVITAGTGLTVTASKGGDTYTATEISTGTYEVSVDSAGTWTVSDGSNTATVAVSASTTYYVTLSSVPDGRTVLPTDDVSIWLACGGRSEAYTTLSEVLNDSVCLSALIADSNAVDYLVRSTSFAKSEALVPTMTSNTTPSGEAFANPENNTYLAFKCFAQDNSLHSKVANNVGSYIGYDFNRPVSISKTLFRGCYSLGSTFKIQGYKNNEWVDITSFVSEAPNQDARPSSYQTISSPGNNIEKVRLYQNTKVSTASNNCDYWELQFYSEEGLTDNATAMSYIGLNNYASNTLLADSTWRSAICNSIYFESVLNVKVPTMTSNTTPSGTASNSGSAYGSSYAWWAYDGNESNFDQFNNQQGSSSYQFANSIKGVCAKIKEEQGVNVNIYSDNNLVATDTTSKNAWKTIPFNSYISGQTYRANFTISINERIRLYEMQFYGRADI